MIFLVSCVRPLVSHVRPNVRPCGHDIFSCPYFLVYIFNVTTISCPMLRPVSCLTMFCDHNFSLVCRFNLQISQNYINMDTDEIQHWFCYFVQSLWNNNTINYVSGRTVAHFTIFSSPIQIPFSFCSIWYCIELCRAHTTRMYTWMYTHQFEH